MNISFWKAKQTINVTTDDVTTTDDSAILDCRVGPVSEVPSLVILKRIMRLKVIAAGKFLQLTADFASWE